MIKQGFHAQRTIRKAGEKNPPGPVTTYKLDPEEIEKRYGRPGELAEKLPSPATIGWPVDGEKNEHHIAITKRNEDEAAAHGPVGPERVLR